MKLSTFSGIVTILAVAFATSSALTGWDASDDLYLRYMTALGHGDACNYEVEELRQNWTSSIMDTSTYQKLLSIRRWKSTVLAKQENFCSATKLLVCSKDTRTCVCGDPGKRALGFPDFPSNYTQEIVDNQTKCRWSENTGCVAVDMPIPAQMRPFMDSKCATGTTCKTKSGTSDCTMMSVVLHALFNGIRSERRLAADIFNGQICSCKTNVVLPEDSSENEIDSNAGHNRLAYRTKRDVQSGQSQSLADEDENYLMASFGGAIPSASAIY